MRCPHCRVRLEKTKTEAGFLYSCRQCRGRAVSFAVLRKVTTLGHVKGLFLHAKRAKSNRDRKPFSPKCPVCQQVMAAVHVPAKTPDGSTEDREIEIDVCIGCQFVWFDSSELERLPKQPQPVVEKKKKPMSPRASEALAMAQIESVERKAQWQSEIDGIDSPDDSWKWIPGILGMPVEGEGTSVGAIPWATWGISAALVAIYLVTLGPLNEMIQQFGLIPAQAARLLGATFLTSFFLHAGWMHLVGNVYFLLVFGDNVEECVGWMKYVLLIFFATFVGSLLHILADPRSAAPLVGASGGISGVIVFYALAFPNARLGILIGYWWYLRWIFFPAYFGVVAWVIFQSFLAYLQIHGIGHVSALAHLGGASVGFGAWFLWRHQRENDTLSPRRDDYHRI